MQATLSQRHRVITDAGLVFMRRLDTEDPQRSRRRLSEKLCQAWNRVQLSGTLREMVCRGMRLILHRRDLIELPPMRRVGLSSLSAGGEGGKGGDGPDPQRYSSTRPP